MSGARPWLRSLSTCSFTAAELVVSIPPSPVVSCLLA